VAQPGIKELLEAGVHFGHQTRRWNPKMRRFLHGERDGIYIIDLLKTKRLLDQASEFAGTIAHRGGAVLFVGTKKQARDAVREVAEATGMPYVNHRWLGGLLTNFQTMSERIRRLHDLERYEAEGQLALLPTRERLSALADLAKLRANLGGVKNMKGTPAAIFVIDLKTEAIAVREAQRLRIPIIGLVDTNCDPDGIDFVIPGNDDAIRSCAVIARAIGERVGEGAGIYRAEQERLRAEAEERARRDAEERARREAEQAAAEAAAAEAAAAEAAVAAAAAQAAEAQAAAQQAEAQQQAAAQQQAEQTPEARAAQRQAAAEEAPAEEPTPPPTPELAAHQPQAAETEPPPAQDAPEAAPEEPAAEEAAPPAPPQAQAAVEEAAPAPDQPAAETAPEEPPAAVEEATDEASTETAAEAPAAAAEHEQESASG
jgi:small subunit ribosomal protein S2